MRDRQRLAAPIHRHAVLGVELSLDAEHGRALLYGELDMASTDWLRTVLDQVRQDGCRFLVLDLSQLKFLGVTGLEVIVRIAGEYAEAGGQITLTRPTRIVRRILDLTGLNDHLALVERPDSPSDPDATEGEGHSSFSG
jgi:anti-sigma B factor antagonist